MKHSFELLQFRIFTLLNLQNSIGDVIKLALQLCSLSAYICRNCIIRFFSVKQMIIRLSVINESKQIWSEYNNSLLNCYRAYKRRSTTRICREQVNIITETKRLKEGRSLIFHCWSYSGCFYSWRCKNKRLLLRFWLHLYYFSRTIYLGKVVFLKTYAYNESRVILLSGGGGGLFNHNDFFTQQYVESWIFSHGSKYYLLIRLLKSSNDFVLKWLVLTQIFTPLSQHGGTTDRVVLRGPVCRSRSKPRTLVRFQVTTHSLSVRPFLPSWA